MSADQVKALRPGDEVYWNDPDGDLCSRVYKIASIGTLDDEDDPPVIIRDVHGSVLECFAHELS